MLAHTIGGVRRYAPVSAQLVGQYQPQFWKCLGGNQPYSNGPERPAGDTPDPKQPPDREHDDTEHQHFQNHERLREYLPQIEQAEKQKAIAGVATSKWGILYDTLSERVANRLLWAPLALVRRTITAPIFARFSDVGEHMLSNEIENDFETAEFIDGVKDAVAGVMDAVAAREYTALRDMAADCVVESLELSAFKLEEQNRLRLAAVDTRVNAAALSGVSLWGPASIRLMAPSWLTRISANTTKSWLVLAVSLDVTFDVQFERTGPQRGNLNMQVDRRGTWLFARGPLPPGVSRSLYLKWYVLGWW